MKRVGNTRDQAHGKIHMDTKLIDSNKSLSKRIEKISIVDPDPH